jgi:hypothetical protein
LCSCGIGEYKDDENAACSLVFDGLSESIGGMNVTNLDLQVGYWRTGADSMEVLPCLSDEHCLGGSDLSELCSEGHEGPLCATCQEGFAAVGAGADLSCEECTGSALATIAAGGSVFFVIVSFFIYRLCKSRTASDAASEAMDDFDRASESADKYSEKIGVITDLISKYQPMGKIFLSYFQIVCGLSFVYDLKFPDIFTKIIRSMSSVVNLDIVSFMP